MPHTTFEDFGLPAKLTHALKRIKFTTPTPIQSQTIPLALDGKDVLGSAQTGTGKTGAFGIPLIAGLMNDPDATALIMTPTRELASQVLDSLEPMIPVPDIRTALLIGGESMPKQFHQLNRTPRLVVGTPGRINDHLERGSLKLDHVRFLVLDETDRMLDMGFGIQIERILKYVPSERQTLLFSATMPPNIGKLSSKYMREPVRVAIGSTTMPMEKIKQEVFHVTDAEKYDKLLEQLDNRAGSVIVFAKTKWGTQKLSDRLNKDGHRSDAIHGDLQQRRRGRVIQNFRDQRYRILVATDVAARGLDIPHIAHVINYDVPQAPEDFIHRIGRTARAGAEGEAISFITPADNSKWRAIQRLIGGTAANDAEPRNGGNQRRRFSPNGGRGRFGGNNRPSSTDPRKKAWTPLSPEKSRDEAGAKRKQEHADDRRDNRHNAAAQGENAFDRKKHQAHAKPKRHFGNKRFKKSANDDKVFVRKGLPAAV